MRATLDAANEVTTVDYFATGIANAIDNVIGPDGALYSVAHGGTVYRLAYTNYTSQQLLVTPTHLRLDEGGAAAVTVRLATAPATEVTVEVARSSGASTIRVDSGATLTFGPANWAVPQGVRLRATFDANTSDDSAEFTFAATGASAETAMVYARDVVALEPFSLAVGAGNAGGGSQPFELRLIGQPAMTYVLEGTADIAGPWIPLSTNTLTGTFIDFTDLESVNWPWRFYRARLAP
jgi:hypothetical protein